MARSVHIDGQLRMSMPASLDSIEDLLVQFRGRSEAMQDRVNRFTAELLVREALTNAVLHGCGGDPAKYVRCVLRVKGRTLLIAVEDDGEGFNWHRWGRNAPASLECSGRGIAVLYHYADHVRFNSKGNAVVMIKRLR